MLRMVDMGDTRIGVEAKRESFLVFVFILSRLLVHHNKTKKTETR